MREQTQANKWWSSLSIAQMKAEAKASGVMWSLAELPGFQEDIWNSAGKLQPGESRFEANGELKRCES